MKLSAEQIEKLYQFTRAHFVYHYDVQTELVDHLANDIELQWQTAPELSFDATLDIAFKKFGIFGFQDVVEARLVALTKHYWKSVWDIFKSFFTLPKLLLTLSIYCITYAILKYTPYLDYTLVFMFVVFFSVVIVKLTQINKSIKEEQKTTGKKWLYQDVLLQLGGMCGVVGVFIQIIPRITPENVSLEPIKFALLCLVLVSFGILSYILLVVVPKNITKYLKAEYKRYFV
ncbi:hypothetical protein [Formosa haliotis]|uniref:hypothetical protein n=1 Tax=Formosa haliotis TaxID=1555194 RepID=UPI000824962F|nr:hypothetical protein [Formosa haliotis]